MTKSHMVTDVGHMVGASLPLTNEHFNYGMNREKNSEFSMKVVVCFFVSGDQLRMWRIFHRH